MGAQESAPAHTNGGKHGNGVAINPTMGDEARNQAQGSAHRTESRDGERHKMRIVETKEPLKNKIDLDRKSVV